ncbi:MAG: hypothetical protein J6S67_20820 [Methanobrevibacter sp.]|nr:hypothetical protein [Methanobrevibacter sp.]
MNTLKLDIKELEIDEFQNEIATREYDRYFNYDETFKTQVILPPNSQYRDILFNEVTSPVALVIVSDKKINANVNGFEITNTKMVLLNTHIDTLQIANVDLLNATITIYIWGKQG